jgi:hypothetical protein
MHGTINIKFPLYIFQYVVIGYPGVQFSVQKMYVGHGYKFPPFRDIQTKGLLSQFFFVGV